jgi:predicted nucleotidyltransferase
MEQASDSDLSERLPLAELRSAFDQHPVRLAFCFGSQATGPLHDDSDIDLAIELDGVQPGDEAYNDVFFEVYSSVTAVLDREDVDLVDIHSASNSLARAVFDTGVLLYGEPERAEQLRNRVGESDDRHPRDRLDSAIEQMDEHLA